MSSPSSVEAPRTPYDAAMRKLPPGLRHWVEGLLSRWPGRVVLRVAAAAARIELFDRSMTIAAQFFTSIIPILIAFASWMGSDANDLFADAGVPAEVQSLLDEALAPSTDETAFGIIGIVLVLGSATSLSRALTRAFAAIWELPRPTIKLHSAWRWVAAVLALAMAIVAARTLPRIADDVPPATFWRMVASATVDVGIAVCVPWLLLAGRVRARHLLPGAVIFAVAMAFVRPASKTWLPHALELSADRYGSIGVAFTYLAWLYAFSFCLLASAVLGQVITSDPGRFGRWLRGRYPVPAPEEHVVG